jgi:hypothetical protein
MVQLSCENVFQSTSSIPSPPRTLMIMPRSQPLETNGTMQEVQNY